MNLSKLEEAILAYYLSHGAAKLDVVGRWYPFGELVLTMKTLFEPDVRPFGFKVAMATQKPSEAFLTQMVGRGAFATKENEFGGSMHQFLPDVYRTELKTVQAENALIQEASAAGEGFWEAKFAELTA